MNIANALTLFRIFLSPVIVTILLLGSTSNKYILAFILFIVACITDYLDGKFARSMNQITNFGKIADPLADKILIIPLFLCFFKLGFVSFLPILVIVLREIIVTAVRFFILGKNKTAVSANFFGKTKTVLQFLFISFVLLEKILAEYIKFNMNIFGITAFAWAVAIISLISGGIYIFSNRKLIFGNYGGN